LQVHTWSKKNPEVQVQVHEGNGKSEFYVTIVQTKKGMTVQIDQFFLDSLDETILKKFFILNPKKRSKRK